MLLPIVARADPVRLNSDSLTLSVTRGSDIIAPARYEIPNALEGSYDFHIPG